ncbi:MAG: aldo/keto reductase [Gemmatimonadaceae bacterium]
MPAEHPLPAVPLVPLCANGPKLSAIVAGAWRMAEWKLSRVERVRWIEECVELGVTSFDHADIYGDYQVETLFGEALAAAPALRARVQLVSKCGIKLVSTNRPSHGAKSYDTSRAHILASVDRSLVSLGVDHLDLLLLHRLDALMDPNEVAETFADLRQSGKVRHVGVSNHSPSQFAMLHRRCSLATNQVELSPLQMSVLSDGTLDQSIDLGIRPMIWSPLGGGRIFTESDASAVRVRAALEQVGADHGVEAPTIAYAWLLRHPSRPVPITGSRRISAIREAVAALDVSLSSDEWYSIWVAGAGRQVP